jgi:hypothetical protein
MKYFFVSFLIFGLLLINACKEEEHKKPSNTAEPTDRIKADLPTKTSSFLLIKDKNGQFMAEIDFDKMQVKTANTIYKAKIKEDKIKYYTNGKLVYEVKTNEDDYKLKDAGSNLLWKVKVYSHKINISNNEENTDAYEIRNNNDVIQIFKKEETIQTMEIKGSGVMVSGSLMYTFTPENNSFAAGIFAIREIPVEQQVFLFAHYLYLSK